MSEGRRSQVVLLDERRLEIVIQSKLYACELLDIVASHFNLKEKEYFGIAYLNDTGQYSWLQLDKRVLEHEFPKKSSSQGATLTLFFKVKYFVESITQLHDAATVEAFYLQAKSLLAKGEVEVDSETVFQLAALVLQATFGDYVDDSMSKSQLKRLPVLPTSALKEHPSITVCEDKVLQHYKALAGQSRGAAIVNYLSIVESLSTYGQHYYEIKDKSGFPCWLGLSYRGISQYDKNDRRTPRRVFLWKQLENLYFRDRKFTIEVHEARRVIHTLSSFNLYEDAIEEPVEEFDDLSDAICDPTTQVSVSRRTLAPANVTVYVWYAVSAVVTKCIWSMAIAQHHFFLDRSHQKSQTSLLPSLSQIASELCRSLQSLSSASSQSNISRSTSSNSLPATIILEGEISEESKAATIEMLTALRARKEALEDVLKKKTEELKVLCIKEGELTGEIPPETPVQTGEAQPHVRRRIGTSFTLSDKFMCRGKGKERETLNNLELDYEIQSKIASAAFQLAHDCTARKSVRKQRKISYYQATTKLRDIEEKLSTLKKQKDKNPKKGDRLVADGSDGEDSSHLADNKVVLDDSGVNLSGSIPDALISAENTSTEESNAINNHLSVSSVVPCSSLPQLTLTTCDSTSPSPTNHRQRHRSLQHVPLPAAPESNTSSNSICPYELHTWRTSACYAESEYDAVSCGSGSVVSLRVPYKNRFESGLNIEGSNLYSVPNRRASQVFDSQDDLLVGGRKSDFDRQSSSSTILGRHPQDSTCSIPLSSSYDERLWFGRPSELIVAANDHSSLETSFEDQSIHSGETSSLNCFESNSRKSSLVEACRNQSNLTHFHSENSLHRDDSHSINYQLDNTHISEPDLNHPESGKVIPHIRSVPALRPDLSMRQMHGQHSRGDACVGPHSQSINQVADLVQASMLLRDSKRTTSTSSLEYSSPKIKTKEWIETSLDSPLLSKKPKQKQFCEHAVQQTEALDATFQSNNYENLPIGLPPSPNDQFYQEPLNSFSHNDYENVPPHSTSQSFISHSSGSKDFYRSQYEYEELPKQEAASPRSYCFSPVEGHSALEAFQMPSNDAPVHRYTPDSVQVQPFSLCEFRSEKEPLLREESSISYSAVPNDLAKDTPPSYPVTIGVCSGNAELQQFQRQSSHSNFPYEYEIQPANAMSPNMQHFPFPPHREYVCEPSNIPRQFCEVVVQPSSPRFQPVSPADVPDSPRNHPSQSGADANSIHEPVHYTTDSCTSNEPSTVNLAQEVTIPLSSCNPTNFSYPANVEVNVVSVGHFQPYWEETKPYELSDFYKYSTKHRKPQQRSNVQQETINRLDQSPTAANNSSNNEYWMQMAQNPAHYTVIPEIVNNKSLRNSCDSFYANDISSPPLRHKEILVNAHVAVVDRAKYRDGIEGFYEKEKPKNQRSPQSGDENCSFGEAGLRISLADAFHEEMLAWYEDQDAVKKATLV